MQRQQFADVREILDILLLNDSPNIIATDCELKARYACDARPWPFSSADDAASCFSQAIAANVRKYASVKVSVDKAILYLELDTPRLF